MVAVLVSQAFWRLPLCVPTVPSHRPTAAAHLADDFSPYHSDRDEHPALPESGRALFAVLRHNSAERRGKRSSLSGDQDNRRFGHVCAGSGGINQKGLVVGSINDRGSPNFWLWSDGVRHDLPLGNGRSGLAASINNLGQVVGDFLTGEFYDDGFGNFSPAYHAFVWTDGSLRDLGTLGGRNSFCLVITDQGVAVGVSSTADHDGFPFIARDGQMRSLPSLISNPPAWKLLLEAHYVAADGRIWGLAYGAKHHIYEMTPETNGLYRIRSRGVIETIDVVKLFAINEYGQAVGRVRISADRGSAFVRDEQEITLLDAAGRPASYAYSINNLGQVVGMTTFDSPSYNAFLWEDGVMSNLNDLIPADSGIVLTKATANAINDAGQIVCTYRNVASGLYGVCLLLPVSPVPLEISHHELTPAGLSLEVRGGAGQGLAVEYTSDLAHWTTLATSTNLFGKRMFIDPDASGETIRAYRARLLAP